ncbi:MAG: phospholipid carrier-dependent glycosyltransferase [Candidatus Erginobacter occultus]|nr:phospholipid carrier-dependent glycosyltransferase [Candidatus Erginobacter occultus]
MKRSIVYLSVSGVISLFLFLYVIPLGVRPIILPDESRYAEIPREMLATGDWVVPHLNGLRYFEKPVLGYWLTAASIGLFGKNSFAIRFPSALAVGISGLIICLLVWRAGRRRRAGIYSAVIYLTFLEVFGIGTTNILDGVFSLFTTVTLASLFAASSADQSGRRKMWMALGGVCLGLAFLSKGFLAFALPVVVIVPYLFWNKGAREFIGDCWIALACAILVALPWGLTIHFREGDFWHYFFWTEHINRFMGNDPQHPEPIWFFLPVIIVGALPGLALLPAALSRLIRNRFRGSLTRFAVCWFLSSFLFYSASRGKLITYILPCFPPLAIIASLGILEYLKAGKSRLFNAGSVFLLTILIAAVAGLAVIEVFDTPVPAIFNGMEIWKLVIAVNGLLVWALFLLLAVKQNKPRRKIVLFCSAPVLLMFSSHFIFPEIGLDGKAPEKFFLDNVSRITASTILVSDNYCISALGWYYDRSDIILLESEGELEYGLQYPDARKRFINFRQFNEMLAKTPKGESVILVLDNDRYIEYQPFLPRPLFVKTGCGFTMAVFCCAGRSSCSPDPACPENGEI